MKADYVEIEGQFYSKYHRKVLGVPPARIPASAPERTEGQPLVRRVSRKETSGPCFEIVFTVYARRPCDWDGWHIKPIQDLLVRVGALPDDKWNVLSGRVRSCKVSTEAEEGTHITLTQRH